MLSLRSSDRIASGVFAIVPNNRTSADARPATAIVFLWTSNIVTAGIRCSPSWSPHGLPPRPSRPRPPWSAHAASARPPALIGTFLALLILNKIRPDCELVLCVRTKLFKAQDIRADRESDKPSYMQRQIMNRYTAAMACMTISATIDWFKRPPRTRARALRFCPVNHSCVLDSLLRHLI